MSLFLIRQPFPLLAWFGLALGCALATGAAERDQGRAPSVADCETLWKTASAELGSPTTDFLKAHKTVYEIDLPTTEVGRQCEYGACWIFSAVGELETDILGNTGLRKDLSEYYVVTMSLLYRSLAALEKPGKKVEAGGNLGSAEWLIRKYGIVPSSVWTPRVPFMEEPHSKRLVAVLNHLIGHYQLAAAQATDQRERDVLLSQARKEVREYIRSYSGPLPKGFEYQGKSYDSPVEFGAQMIQEAGLEPGMLLKPKREKNLPTELEKLRTAKVPARTIATPRAPMEVFTVPLDEIESQIVESLKRGAAVPLSMEMAREFMDKESGILSTSAFRTPKNFKPLPFAYREAFGLSGGGHLFLAVGARLDAQGKVIAFKIKNSWGGKSGTGGFYHLYRDYFEEYLISALVR